MKGSSSQMRIRINNENEIVSKEEIEEFKTYTDKLADVLISDKYVDMKLTHALKDSYFTLSFVSTDEIKELNREQRQIDKETDVLSFPLLDLKEGKGTIVPSDFEKDEDGNNLLCLGDAVICYDIASSQAEEFGHGIVREVLFLTAHSALHLLGYDHIEHDMEKRMILKQKMLMESIGLAFQDEIEDIRAIENNKALNDIEFPAGSPVDHCGYVSILGRPNVGKSTFINYISGMKVAIVSHKPQTTRTNIRSIYNTEDSQIIFTDTPGVHSPKSKLQEIMVDNSFNSAKNADLVLFLIDSRFTKPGNIEKRLMELCSKYNKKVILAINKCDEISKEQLLPTITEYAKLYEFEDVVPISAVTGYHIELLLDEITKRLPAGPRLFDSEYMTDQTEREIAGELIREQLLHYTNQEIPHGIAIDITKFEERDDDNAEDEYDRKMVLIEASIICERDSHKGIIIGKNGQMIKRIGTASRKNIERMLGTKVYLDLYVKVRKDWKNNDTLLRDYGFRSEEEE